LTNRKKCVIINTENKREENKKMKNIFKRFKKTTTKWVVSYTDTVVGYGEKVKTFTSEAAAKIYLEELKEKNTDPTIEFFMYETR
jgi:hypothetical protein